MPAGDQRGTLSYVPGHAAAGDWAELRAEMDILVVLSTSPHPMDPLWSPAAIRASLRPVPPPGPRDPSRTFRAESARSLDQAERTA